MYDSEERFATLLAANFGTDFAAVLAAHGLNAGNVTAATATVHKRREWVTFADLKSFTQANPGIGVYATAARTNARRQDERLWGVTLIAEYYARGPDPDKLQVQTLMAIEAIVRSVDRMNEGLAGSRVLDAGGPENSIAVETSRTAHLDSGDRYYEELARISFPVVDQEVGLS